MNRFARPTLLALALALLVGTTACMDESLTEVNQNPNEPTDVPAENILPGAVVESADLLWDDFWHMSLWATFGQHYAQIQYPDEDRYQIRLSVLDGYWEDFYNGPLKDFQAIVDKGRDVGNSNVEAVGLIGKSYLFNALTDAWGPIPYSQALKLEEGERTPAYDAQSDIYSGLLSDLDAAQGMIDASSSPFGSNDLVYGGDMTKWKRFANSLRLKLAMRMSNVDQAGAASIVQDAVADGVFQSNADNARLDYLSSSPNRNPVYVNGLTRDDHAPSETMLSMMRDWDDPRITIYAQPAPNSSPSDPMEVRFPGGINGVSAQGDYYESLDDIARIGEFWREDPTAPVWFMTYAEVQFFLAEAAQRGMIGGSAQQYYEEGVTAALNQYGITGSDVDDYLAQPGVAWGSAGMSPMQQIGIQKWLALYGGSTSEMYAEVRRLGYPAIEPGPDASNVNQGHIPARIKYPPIEQSVNSESLTAGISMLGEDTMGQALWWDPDGLMP